MSRYQVLLTSRAEKDYQKLPPQVRQRIQRALLQLERHRTPPTFKLLSGKDIAHYRIRIGDYRILYDVYDAKKAVSVFRIGHRKDIYR